jgi:hypothetical protein
MTNVIISTVRNGTSGTSGTDGTSGTSGVSPLYDNTLPYLELTNNAFTSSFYYNKLQGSEVVDIVDTGLHIDKYEWGWLYNPLVENNSTDESPIGTLWNIDGWDDLSDILTRTYDSFARTTNYDFNNIVVGKEFIMYDTINDKYYGIKFTKWGNSAIGDNSVEYERFLIDIDKINEGIRFSDGTVQKTASLPLKSTAFTDWKISEEYGSSEGTFSADISNQFSGSVAETPTEFSNDIYINRADSTELYDYLNVSGSSAVYIQVDGNLYYSIAYVALVEGSEYIIVDTQISDLTYTSGSEFIVYLGTAYPFRWYNNTDENFRGAIIQYHAYITSENTGGCTVIGTIHISRDSNDFSISHTESSSGDDSCRNALQLWYRNLDGGTEREVYFIMNNMDTTNLKIHWSSKSFYGSDYWD